MKIHLTAAILFACLQAFGQSKTRQVDEAIGMRIREIPTRQDKITFAFDEGGKERYYNRTGDGRKTYTELLQAVVGLITFNDEGGRLISIAKTTNGKTEIVARGPDVEIVNRAPTGNRNTVYYEPSQSGDPVRPRILPTSQEVANTPRTDETVGYSVPDSTEIVRKIDEAKEKITGWKQQMWADIKPVWGFVMWCFSSIIVLLVCFAGICRYVAKTSTNESLINSYGRTIVGGWIVNAQQNAAQMTLVLTWVIAIVLLLDFFMWMVFLNLPLWTMLVVWFPVLWVAERITDWMVPNIQIVDSPHGSGMQPYQKR